MITLYFDIFTLTTVSLFTCFACVSLYSHKIEISRMPPLMIIQLKRFKFNQYVYICIYKI